MPRSGKEYLEGIRADGRDVWLDGERVSDVTAHPSLRDAAAAIADLFDLQLEWPEDCLVDDPELGLVNVSHVVPRSAADLQRRRRGLERMARSHAGLLGRSPDYINVTLAGFAGRADIFAMNGNEQGAANMVAYQRHVAQNDLSTTHAIIHPTVDRRLSVQDQHGEFAVHKVGETADTIVVRGARVLATLAPFADELVVYPGQPVPKDCPEHALAFAIPMNTPGLVFMCRDSYTVQGPAFDRPFSSRFDEQDAVVFFDDVEVPKERVFVDGDPEIYAKVMSTGWTANIMQHTTIRALAKLEFAYALATQMVEAVGDRNPGAAMLLGEIWTYAELTRSALEAAEAGAYEWGNGVWFPDERPFRALRPTLPGWFARVRELFEALGSHNLLTTPTEAELDAPALRPFIERYLRGADVDARDRARIYRAAWDFIGSALGSRNFLYERYYLASPVRTYPLAHIAAQKERNWAEVVADVLDRGLAASRNEPATRKETSDG